MVYLCDLACWRPPQSHAAPIQRLPWGGEFDENSSEEVLKKHPAVSALGFFGGNQSIERSCFFFFNLDLFLSSNNKQTK